ncbi:MAG: GNAT family N-acetyltransferase [Anaerolineaceae bacterium]|nr:GNAT family N-acetyltransferase [Anaerolineaceae bacterium]
MTAKEYQRWLMLYDIHTRLETERLILRIFELEDTEEFFTQVRASYDSLSQFIHWTVETDTLEKMERFVRSQRTRFFRRDDLFYIIIEKESDAMVGYAGMKLNKAQTPTYEMGYSLFQQGVEKGYATEASKALIKLAFEQLKANRIEIVAQRDNTPSRSVAERLGFQFELYLRRHEWNVAHTQLVDLAFYSLIRPEYEVRQKEFDVLL